MAVIEDAGDFEVFFDAEVFGEAASYTGGSPPATVAITGIFTNAHAVAAPLGDWPGVSTLAPLFTCRAAAQPAGAGEGDTLTLGGTAWTVRGIQPDGTGLARLILERT
jgi:hypothetical protein